MDHYGLNGLKWVASGLDAVITTTIFFFFVVMMLFSTNYSGDTSFPPRHEIPSRWCGVMVYPVMQ